MRIRAGGHCVLVGMVLAALSPGSLWAIDRADMKVDGRAIGFNGEFRRGNWTPMQVTIDAYGAKARPVILEWIISDSDGDQVHSQRQFTLNPIVDQRVWLYAAPPVSNPGKQEWEVRLLDAQTNRLLNRTKVSALPLVRSESRAVGVIGTAKLGLSSYEHNYVQHEECRFIRGLAASQIPDRWHGLAMLSALIWAPSRDDPGGELSRLHPESQRAVREWVRRGGHLVIVLPSVADPWDFENRKGPLSDLLPPVRVVPQPQAELPVWMSELQTRRQAVRLPRKALVPLAEPGKPAPALPEGAPREVSVLLRDGDGSGPPLVVASPYGLGRVTVIGLDLADRTLGDDLPDGPLLWTAVFGWQGPTFSKDFCKGESDASRMVRPAERNSIDLDRFVPPLISMKETATAGLLLAIVLFGVYWLLAGPLGFAVLKAKGLVRHSWVAFTAMVLVFAVITWGGAFLMQPKTSRAAHFSVVDFDAASGLVHSHSWLAVFVPEHGQLSVTLDPQGKDVSGHTLASAGLAPSLLSEEQTGYVDTQHYAMDAVVPSRRPAEFGRTTPPAGVLIPMRATAKQLETDCLTQGLPQGSAWGVIAGNLKLGTEPDTRGRRWPVGTVTHRLPGPVKFMHVVYCPGDGAEPVVWRHEGEPWQPGQVLAIGPAASRPPNAAVFLPSPSATAQPMVIPRWRDSTTRTWVGEGYLGQLIAARTGFRLADLPEGETVQAGEINQNTFLLSFFATLPPTAYVRRDNDHLFAYTRTIGRQLDLTHLLPLRRVIVMGLVENSPLPAPLEVSGRKMPSQGWTLVRWIGTVAE